MSLDIGTPTTHDLIDDLIDDSLEPRLEHEGERDVPGAVPLTDDPHPDESLSDALDAFLEAFNARDLDGLLETVADDVEAPGLGYDRDNLPDAIEDIWEQRPSTLLTRGRDGDRCVAVIWELGENGWRRTGVVHVDDAQDGQLGVVEFNDDPAVLDIAETDPPDSDLDEGMRWEEWADGTNGEH